MLIKPVKPTEEPTAPGTIVRSVSGDKVVRASESSPAWWNMTRNCWVMWDEIVDPAIVHHGYSRRTSEPPNTLAVVRDAQGFINYRLKAPAGQPDRVWHRVYGARTWAWHDIPQPVEILFEGVD